MHASVAQAVAALKEQSLGELRAQYATLCGDTTQTNNRIWLTRRIAWRVQAQAEGDLSERARRRAEELAQHAELRLTAPTPRVRPPVPVKAKPALQPAPTDRRLPPPGTVLTRRYKGATVQVQVLAEGFAYDGHVHPSLSAAARAITGSHCNGFLFFRLPTKGAKS
jgi:hypothetical protein